MHNYKSTTFNFL